METLGVSRITLMTFLITLALQLNPSLSGDPCPNKEDLWPCTCIQTPVNPEKSSISMETENMVEVPASTQATAEENKRPLERMKIVKSHKNQTVLTMPEYNGTYYTVVTCKDVKTSIQLEQAITNGLHRKWIDKLIVSNVPSEQEHKFAKLPTEWLQNVRVCQIEIRDSIIAPNFINANNPFKGQNINLLSLTISNCHLSGQLTYDSLVLPSMKNFVHLQRLEVLDLSRNLLVSIDNVAFQLSPANLSFLTLSYNNIELISTSFQKIAKLKHLDLSHNVLTNVYRNFFATPAKALQHIDISWNRLTSLPVDFFNSMPALKIVNLERNFLSVLPEKPWSVVWKQLNTIRLTGNFIECDCQILWLLKMLPQPSSAVTSKPSINSTLEQQIQGTCRFTQPELYKLPKKLTRLTKEDINCV